MANAHGAAGPDVLDALAALVDHHPLQPREPLAGEPRFRRLRVVRELHEESLALYHDLGDRRGTAPLRQHDYGAADALSADGLARMRELGDQQGLALALNHLGMIRLERGEPGAAQALLAVIPGRLEAADKAIDDRTTAGVRSALSEAQCAADSAAG